MTKRTKEEARGAFLNAAEALAADMPTGYGTNFRSFFEAFASEDLQEVYTLSRRLGALAQSPAYQGYLFRTCAPDRHAHMRTANEYREGLGAYAVAAGIMVKNYVRRPVMEELPARVRRQQASFMLRTNADKTPRQMVLLQNRFVRSADQDIMLLVMNGINFCYSEFSGGDGSVQNQFRPGAAADSRLFKAADNQTLGPIRNEQTLARYAAAAVPLG